MSVVKQRPMLVMAGYSCTGVSGLKNRYISWYLMLVAFSSPVKFSKIAFCMTFLRTFAVVLQTQFLLVVANHLKSDFSRYIIE